MSIRPSERWLLGFGRGVALLVELFDFSTGDGCKPIRQLKPRKSSVDNHELPLRNDTLLNKRDYAAAEKFWSPQYIQHSAHIPPGREGLFNLVTRRQPLLLSCAQRLYIWSSQPFSSQDRVDSNHE
jgi:hypothetical protein